MTTLFFDHASIDSFPLIRFHYSIGKTRFQRWAKFPETGVYNKNLQSKESQLFLALTGAALSRYILPSQHFDRLIIKEYPFQRQSLLLLNHWYNRTLDEYRARTKHYINKDIQVICENRINKFENDNSRENTKNRILTLNGGGKDTAVSAYLLKKANKYFDLLTIEEGGRTILSSQRIAEINHGATNHIMAISSRHELGQRNETRFITESLTMPALAAAHLSGYRYVCMSNEFSANFATNPQHSPRVNHQYGKSEMAIRLLNQIIKNETSSDLRIFSALGSLYEIQIAKIFSHMKDHFGSTLSCNNGLYSDAWCGDCAKCANIFLILGAWIESEHLAKIFHKDHMHNDTMHNHVMSLFSQERAYECIATPKEAIVAANLFLKRHKKEIPKIFAQNLRKLTKDHPPIKDDHYLGAPKKRPYLPEDIAEKLMPLIVEMNSLSTP